MRLFQGKGALQERNSFTRVSSGNKNKVIAGTDALVDVGDWIG